MVRFQRLVLVGASQRALGLRTAFGALAASDVLAVLDEWHPLAAKQARADGAVPGRPVGGRVAPV
jgi:hypothetical protein